MMSFTWHDSDRPYLRHWTPYSYRAYLLWYLAVALYVRDLHSPVAPAGSC